MEGSQRAAELAVEHSCVGFVQWDGAKSPKEYEEMELLAKVEARTAQWREEDVRWRKATEDAIEARQSKSNRAAILAAALSAILTVALTLFGQWILSSRIAPSAPSAVDPPAPPPAD